MVKLPCFAAMLALSAAPAAVAGPRPEPVIDMHLHAYSVDFVAAKTPVCTGDQPTTYPPIDPREPFDPARMTACPRPMIGAASDDALMRETLALLKRYNVRRAVTSGEALGKVAKWHAASDRIVPAIGFGTQHPLPVAELRRLHAQGAFAVFAEVSTQSGTRWSGSRDRFHSDPAFDRHDRQGALLTRAQKRDSLYNCAAGTAVCPQGLRRCPLLR